MAEQSLGDNEAVIGAEPSLNLPDLSSVLGTVQEHWLGSFLLNLLGYGLIILPAAFFIRRWKKDPAVQSGEYCTHFSIYFMILSASTHNCFQVLDCLCIWIKYIIHEYNYVIKFKIHRSRSNQLFYQTLGVRKQWTRRSIEIGWRRTKTSIVIIILISTSRTCDGYINWAVLFTFVVLCGWSTGRLLNVGCITSE